MTCPACGDATSATEAKFCEACGAPLTPGSSLPGSAAPAFCAAHQTTSMCGCSPGESKPDDEGFCENCGIRCVAASYEDGVSNPHRINEEIDERLALVSDIGKRHSHNEDCGTVARGENGEVVLVVADGVSTSFHPAGASAETTRIVKEMLLAAYAPEEAMAVMKTAIATAHETVMALPCGDNPDIDGPECTVVAARVSEGNVIIGWVGDSRAYLLSEHAEKLLTVDDSWVEEVVKAGLHTREEANSDRRAHCVTQVLGMKDDKVEIHVISTEIAPNETLLLCSDGLWNYFQQDGSLVKNISEMKEKLGADLTSNAICQAVVEEANAQGGHDNITVATLLG